MESSSMNYQRPPYPETSLLFKVSIHFFACLWFLRGIYITRLNYINVDPNNPYYKDIYIAIGLVGFLVLFAIYWVRWLLTPINQTFTSSITLRQCYESHVDAIKNLVPYYFGLFTFSVYKNETDFVMSRDAGEHYIKRNIDSFLEIYRNPQQKIAVFIALIFGVLILFSSNYQNSRGPNHWGMGILMIFIFHYFFMFGYAALIAYALKFIKGEDHE
jgi:hypothetical protein